MKLPELAQRLSLNLRRTNATLLRLFLRLVPSETHRVFALTLIAGASCGLAAVLFHLSIIGAENRLIEKAMSAGGARPKVLAVYPLVRAMVRMDKSGVRQLAVVDGKDGNRLIGLLTMSDIVRAHAQAAVAAGDQIARLCQSSLRRWKILIMSHLRVVTNRGRHDC